MIVLGDGGSHARQGDPDNLKVCRKDKWNERMVVETLFSRAGPEKARPPSARTAQSSLGLHLRRVQSLLRLERKNHAPVGPV